LLDNGVYEITGGQKTAAANNSVDFAGLARAAGFHTAACFCDNLKWRDRACEVLSLPGPRFIGLKTEPEGEDYMLNPPCAMRERLTRLRAALKS
jgi:hypothetical protein